MKISFCTTCMDRLSHLSQTYLLSIENTKSYEQREFILLNYASKDNMDDWVKTKLSNHINAGLVKYYKTNEPTCWSAAHAKNISQKLASGDILVNLDCDNILVEGYCEYLCGLFRKENVIVASNPTDKNGNNGSCGMIASKKEHFYNVKGYDENFNIGWGMDDTNYQYRCRMHNNLELIIQDIKYNLCLDHSNDIRTQNCKNKDIKLTRDLSEDRLKNIAKNKKYIVNKIWGKANLEYNFKEKIII